MFRTENKTSFFRKKSGNFKNNGRKYAAWEQKMENLNKKPANVVRYNEQNKDKNVHICLNVETHKGFNTFEGCVASGASAHMCNDEKYFIKLNK